MPTTKRKVARKPKSTFKIVGATKGKIDAFNTFRPWGKHSSPSPELEAARTLGSVAYVGEMNGVEYERLLTELDERLKAVESERLNESKSNTIEIRTNYRFLPTPPEHTGDGFSGGRPLKQGLWARAIGWLTPKS